MTTTDEFELKQLIIDLTELKDQVVKLKQAESSYASELATFRTNYQRLSKYFNKMSEVKKKSREGKEIAEVLEGIDRSRPMKAHWLLQLLLGNQLTYKLLTPSDRLAFKKGYENFKIITTLVHLFLSFFGIFFLTQSTLYDGFIPLYTVVVYLIIIWREAVLKMNGSNIRGWWFAHHILSMLLSGVMIIWDKNSLEYSQIRSSLFYFYFYIGAVQVLQYRYQMNRLYALRSLSRVDPMETTNELAQNLIHHNLLFLLPFLSIAYAFEFYLAHLFWIHTNGPATLTISFLYFILASGNTLTTCYTYYRKIYNCPLLNRREDEGRIRKKNLLVRQFTKSSEDLNLNYKNNKIKEYE